jgi:methyl-accepting chemotaxis protein
MSTALQLDATEAEQENHESTSDTRNTAAHDESSEEKNAIYQAALQHVMHQLPDVAGFVENAASDIVKEFRSMAEVNTTQATNIEQVLEISQFIKVEDDLLAFDKCIDELYRPMADATSNILAVSKLAMAMVLSVSNAADNIRRVEKFIDEIQDITKQTNMLAMNTQIEAVKAGEAGKSFQFIASEVKTLSQDIKRLSIQMQEDISEVAGSVKESSKVIEQLANYDMTKNMGQKERVDAVMEAINAQNATFTKHLEDAIRMNRENASNINHMVMNIQFQDRTSQVLGDVKTLLGVIHNFIRERMPATQTSLSGAQTEAILEELLDDVKLTDMRRQLITALYSMGVVALESPTVAKYTSEETATTSSSALESDEGDIELF